ncbi:hypothetical protein FNF28_01331 [Cafeteria roenbergensis]|nr:hypothetical protein FNF28_01331 [Cafeteria roenbergensis]
MTSAARKRRATIALAADLSTSVWGGLTMSLAILSWLAVAVGAVCLLAAAVSTSGKWDALCTLRVAEAFPAGSDPAAAAAWLCPLRLDAESTEQALGFSCDLLLPTTPPTLAGNASNTTLDPSALAIPLQYNDVDGVCFVVAGVMAVLSALLAIGTLPAEAVPSPRGSGSKRPVTIPEAAASICWVVLVVQAVGMACWAGQLLECWGSVWLGVAPSLRDPTLVSELQCGSGWTTALAVCILLWGALPVPLACAGAAVRWPGMRNLVCDARGHVAVRLLGSSMIGASLLVFSMALPEYNSDTFVAGLFLTLFFAILGLGARLLHLLFERSQTPFDGERLLRHFQVPTGLRGSVTTDVAKDALAVVQARLR